MPYANRLPRHGGDTIYWEIERGSDRLVLQTVKQAPGVTLEATLVRISELAERKNGLISASGGYAHWRPTIMFVTHVERPKCVVVPDVYSSSPRGGKIKVDVKDAGMVVGRPFVDPIY